MRTDKVILLDTNIIVYATNTACEFHKIALKIREDVIKGKVKGCVSLQNLSEFYSIITSRKRVQNPLSPETAVEEIKKYIMAEELLKIHFNKNTVGILCDLAKKYNVVAQSIYDLKIVATMIDNGINGIYTDNDKDFKQYSEVRVINPFKD
ncbi:MAG: type II toxin-antitoxin system VapC family toxin [Candidatus Omnitrophota bacterium]|nr:type II toxin-antitoxin system VapC family toxin [Candidatus Omnitrophota bacterium]